MPKYGACSSVTTSRGSPFAASAPRTSASSPNCSGPPISRIPSTGASTAVRPTPAATSAAAIGWNRAEGSRTVPSTVLKSAMAAMNSKNWVACTSEYGSPDSRISVSCAALARKYPDSCSRSVPTTESAT
jgi:hypothetical protein